MSQRFGGGDLVQEKREKLSIKTGGRTDSKTPEAASSNAALNCLQEDWTAWSGAVAHVGTVMVVPAA